MKKCIVLILIVLIGLFMVFASGKNMRAVKKTGLSIKPGHVQMDLNFGKFPLYFIANKGQVNKKAKFYAKASRYTLWLTKEGLVFETKFNRDVSRLFFLNANKNPQIAAVDETKLKVNYFIGNDKSKWHCDVPTSQAVLYKNLYKNIDLKVYGIEKQIEYDWIVKPGGNPGDIRFEYKNVKGTRLDENGNLLVETKFGELKHKRPVSFQEIGRVRGAVDDVKRTVHAAFKKIAENTYGFEVGEYDKNCELIIDPVVLAYSTYLGGGVEDQARAIAVDNNGHAYVTGPTESSNFPPLDENPAGRLSSTQFFITKIDTNQDGRPSLIYSAILGGSSIDDAMGIAVDGRGYVYVAGETFSNNFPTVNPYQVDQPHYDAFLVKIDTTQSGAAGFLYSTYLGGDGEDRGRAIAVDDNENAYLTGLTISTDFPTLNEYQAPQGHYDGFVTKIDTNESGSASLVYSTYLGGHNPDYCRGIAVDSSGYTYVTGYTTSSDFPVRDQYQNRQSGNDAFITKIDTTQGGDSSLIYSTFLGGNDDDYALAIAVDNSENAFVTGYTYGTDFPIMGQYQTFQGGSYDAFVTRIDTTISGVSGLVYSTYLGGWDNDIANGIALDGSGNAYVTGYTDSTNFPTLNCFQENQGETDVYVAKIDTTQSGTPGLIYSTYLGGGSWDYSAGIAADGSGNAYVTGFTFSTNFPTLNQYQEDQTFADGFVTRFNVYPTAPPTVITTPVSSITTTSASGGGNVTSDGGTEVTTRGVCWSTSENPTTDDNHTTDGSGTGIFNSSMTNLTPNTVYYVRAYAANSVDTAYGNEETFETVDPSIAVTYPNGGEILVVGSGHNITWTSDGVAGNVTIEYSIDNGQNWTEIVSATENDGSYPWTVPPAPSYLCLIRVSQTGGGPSDTNDSVFTIAVSAVVIPASEREALIALYNSTRGFQWLSDTNWKKPDGSFNDPGTEHTWYGITVENNHVSEINLPNNELEDGTLPAEIGNLSQLTKLDLKQSYVPSYDPLFGPLPATIGNLGQLRHLDLNGHDFSGNIPAEFWNLTNLEYLDLNDNELTGGIPSALGNLANLGTLSVRNNKLSGSIPDSLTNLGNLTYISLSGNDFNGDIPTDIGNLTNLVCFSLSGNAITGGIPSGLGNLVKLNILQLNGNKLVGSIPTGLTNLTALAFTDIGCNALYTDDDNLMAFLNQKDPDWESTQTTAPSDVSAAVLSYNSVELSWTPIIYTAGQGGYRVFYSTTEGGPYTLFDMTADKTVSSMTITGLNPGTAYYFVVQTRTQPGLCSGNTVDSDYSNEVSAATYSSITVTSPNGGENWDVGSSHAISWTSEGTVGNVRIEYSTNGGSSWTTIVQSAENNGSYNWTVPNRPSDNCLVRVSEKDVDGGGADISDAVFSIVSSQPPPSGIRVASPNGGETWAVGSSQQINWTSTGDINNVTINYSTDNGTTWKTIAQTTTNDGSYDWTVPGTVSDECLVQIIANDGDGDPKPSDVSDRVFAIVLPASPTIRVTAPNGGEQLVVGSRFNMTWFTTNSREEAKIEYSTNGGQSWTEIAPSTANDGEYDWTVPGTPSDSCLVRVGETDGDPIDISDAVFSIVQPSPGDIAVTSPNGGETWAVGSSQQITWNDNGDINNVTIKYSIDNGTTWKGIVQTTANNGSFDWTVPDTVSGECLVQVTANDGNGDPKPSDVSDAVFAIVLPASPTIRVTAPNGGEQLAAGSRFNITWYATNSREEAKIEYSTDGGQSWTEITASTANDGEYDWIVPDEPSEICLVRISETDGDPLDISDAVFSIARSLPGDITVTSPNGGESWDAGSLQEIKWTGSGEINNVAIEYSTDNGITWTTISAATANNGSFDWAVPDTVSDECLVRVTAIDDDLDPKPSDVSDQVFSIVSPQPGSFRLTSPNGGETWEVGSTRPVTWNSTGNINSVMIEYSYNNGNTWTAIVSSTNNSGTYDWQVPDTVSDECLVRVTAVDGGDPRPSDVSDSQFSIVPPASPTITVTAPNGGEQLSVGSSFNITWYATGSREEASIEYSTDGGQSWTEIAASTANDGEYDWTIPDEPSGNCLIRVSETDGDPLDISDAVFSIIQPIPGDLAVLTPNGGENLDAGSAYDITWTTGIGLNNVILEYSLNNGGSWATIDKVPADNGVYNWTVPAASSDNCLVRVSGADSDENPSDVSDEVFTITDPSQAFVEVLTPNGGENLPVGSQYQITWTSTGINNVLIEYSADNRSSWHTIETVPAGEGVYTWVIPDTPSDTCLVRISGNDTPGDPSDVSDALFSITSN